MYVCRFLAHGYSLYEEERGETLEKPWMEGRINWCARYGSVNTSGSPPTILENTFLPRDNIYI